MLEGVDQFWKWLNSSPQWRTKVAGELLPILIKGYRKTNLGTKQFRIWKFILNLESHKVTEIIRCRLTHDRHVFVCSYSVYRSGIRFNQRLFSPKLHTYCSFLAMIQMFSLPDVGHAVTDKSVQCMHNNLNQDDGNSEDVYYVFNIFIYYFYYIFFTLQNSVFYCLTINMRL